MSGSMQRPAMLELMKAVARRPPAEHEDDDCEICVSAA